jgi:hypothetical protein
LVTLKPRDEDVLGRRCGSSASGPNFVSVGFSAGGSKCTLGDAASSFAVGVPVHTVLTMSPALLTGGTVKVAMQKDGAERSKLARQSP